MRIVPQIARFNKLCVKAVLAFMFKHIPGHGNTCFSVQVTTTAAHIFRGIAKLANKVSLQ